MAKYACLNPIAKAGLSKFGDNYTRVEDILEADVILVRSANMLETQLPENILAVARAGAGVNNIPIEKYAEQGIVVFNTPGANANGVKEAVIAGMLLASRDIVGGIEWVRDNADSPDIAKLCEKQKKQYAGFEIKGKKLGIIGLGAVGQLVANAGVSLGMEVYGYDPYISVDAAWNLSRAVHHINDVKEIYKTCDYITIHVPLLDSTRGMIDEEAISVMKRNVVILNFARDLLVDEEALIVALREGRVRKYVTDFANTTVCSVNSNKVIITPHIGASTAESEENCAIMAVSELKDYVENGNIRNSVNFPRCDIGPCESAGRVALAHKNVPNVIRSVTEVLSAEGLNISDLTNKSRGEFAYTLVDLDTPVTDAVIDGLKRIDGVIRVRKVK